MVEGELATHFLEGGSQDDREGPPASSLTDCMLLPIQIAFYPNHALDSKHLLNTNCKPGTFLTVAD